MGPGLDGRRGRLRPDVVPAAPTDHGHQRDLPECRSARGGVVRPTGQSDSLRHLVRVVGHHDVHLAGLLAARTERHSRRSTGRLAGAISQRAVRARLDVLPGLHARVDVEPAAVDEPQRRSAKLAARGFRRLREHSAAARLGVSQRRDLGPLVRRPTVGRGRADIRHQLRRTQPVGAKRRSAAGTGARARQCRPLLAWRAQPEPTRNVLGPRLPIHHRAVQPSCSRRHRPQRRADHPGLFASRRTPRLGERNDQVASVLDAGPGGSDPVRRRAAAEHRLHPQSLLYRLGCPPGVLARRHLHRPAAARSAAADLVSGQLQRLRLRGGDRRRVPRRDLPLRAGNRGSAEPADHPGPIRRGVPGRRCGPAGRSARDRVAQRQRVQQDHPADERSDRDPLCRRRARPCRQQRIHRRPRTGRAGGRRRSGEPPTDPVGARRSSTRRASRLLSSCGTTATSRRRNSR